MRTLRLFIPFVMLAFSTQADAKYLKMAGVPVATCSEPKCGGLVVKVVPWDIKQYRQMVHSPNAAEEPYRQLNVKEQAGLIRLSRALLRPLEGKPAKTAFDSLPAEYWYAEGPSAHRPSSFDELRKSAISRSCPSTIHSLSDAEEKGERYGMIALDCNANGKTSHTYVGVALRAGRPVRMYFGFPQAVWAPLQDEKPENAQ